MSLAEIEKKLNEVIKNLDEVNFIFDFLDAYNQPKATINRLKKGDYNKSNIKNELIWSKKIHFKKINNDEDVHFIIDEIQKSDEVKKNKIRFLIVTDFSNFLSIDLKTKDTLDIPLKELHLNAQFFLPLIGLFYK